MENGPKCENALKNQVQEYLRLEADLTNREQKVLEMRSELKRLQSDIVQDVTPGSKRFLKVGRKMVMVENPMNMARLACIEVVEVE